MGVDIIYCYGRGPAPSSTESLLVDFTVDVEIDSNTITSDEHKAIAEVLWRKSVISVAQSSCPEVASILGDDGDFSASSSCNISNSASKSCMSYQGAVTVEYSTEIAHPTTEEMTATILNGINRTATNGDFFEGVKSSVETISNKTITEIKYVERNDNKDQNSFAASLEGNFVVEGQTGLSSLAIGMIVLAGVTCAFLLLLFFFCRRKRLATRGKSLDETDEVLTLPIENQDDANKVPGDDEVAPHEDFEILYLPPH
mmetsp:Transcript_22333/g.32979  ORF Transcript_22333/g.32979 Transcript_22333/m.32979 type:complete len:257 (+) Transcript_22333:51-821(+)|eukprot:CAMPEP_0194213264 /NCGR_PEP_ID=MMETSP0156-20130528/13680_1 /TAXON_ID=33649 /ORGANISM="Thalassionema nitzschioides, Strain L26-B" /LENGTH=256 /DNA_ID=CAMNT_0038941253 /DNA_START=9 /DNA_END=779 /DNA_ORIENTATION=+